MSGNSYKNGHDPQCVYINFKLLLDVTRITKSSNISELLAAWKNLNGGKGSYFTAIKINKIKIQEKKNNHTQKVETCYRWRMGHWD